MADGPALALQQALVAALKVDVDLGTLVGGRVYDEPPQAAVTPYVRLGEFDLRPLRADGATAWAVTFTVEIHSRPTAGRVEATRAAEAVVAALDGQSEAVQPTGFRLPWLEFVTQVVRRQADGRTYEGRIVFDAAIETSA